jgi:hypothetical protein
VQQRVQKAPTTEKEEQTKDRQNKKRTKQKPSAVKKTVGGEETRGPNKRPTK